MSKVEWFRRTSWTSDDQAEFASRLRRVRTPFKRAQYLRIQALHLQEVGEGELTCAALGLLDRLLAEDPEPTQLSAAHMQRAECLVDLGRPEEALEAYRCAFEAQRREPNWRNSAYLGFGELVIALRRRELMHEASAVLDEFGGDEVFPIDRYRAGAIRALIAEEQGSQATAREWARSALTAAAATESPFRRHRKLGLVRSIEPEVFEHLKRLAT